MAFSHLIVLEVPADLKPLLGRNARILVASDEPLPEHLVVSGKVGNQDIEVLEVQPIGSGLSGYVADLPQEGDALMLKVGDGDLVDTGLTVSFGDSGPVA
jgi:hypothetical protein